MILIGFVLFIASIGYTTYQNHNRINENAKTAQALCDAAAGARDFWIQVRASTVLLLSDRTLSPIERRSNRQFVRILTDVIHAADGVAHRCDGRQ